MVKSSPIINWTVIWMMIQILDYFGLLFEWWSEKLTICPTLLLVYNSRNRHLNNSLFQGWPHFIAPIIVYFSIKCSIKCSQYCLKNVIFKKFQRALENVLAGTVLPSGSGLATPGLYECGTSKSILSLFRCSLFRSPLIATEYSLCFNFNIPF